jgi:hypothetical protein
MSKKITALSDRISKEFLSDFEDNVSFTKPDIEAIILLAVTETFVASTKGYFNSAEENKTH